MIFIRSDAIVKTHTVVFTPEGTAVEAVETLGASLVTISTLHSSSVGIFDDQHIEKTTDSKISGQLVKASSNDSRHYSTFSACYEIMVAIRL